VKHPARFLGIDLPEGVPPTEQQRACMSPIGIGLSATKGFAISFSNPLRCAAIRNRMTNEGIQ
jgi:hypothetical protein